MTVAANHFNNDLRYRDSDHPSQTQFTPEYVLGPVRRDLMLAADGRNVWLDPCTTSDNPVGADRFFTVADDGLRQQWGSPVGRKELQSVFCNPPYGKAREPWVHRCIKAGERGQPVVLLMPAAADTRVFQRAAMFSDYVVFIQGRVKFGVLRPNRRQVAASHPSALFFWGAVPKWSGSLGVVMSDVGREALKWATL